MELGSPPQLIALPGHRYQAQAAIYGIEEAEGTRALVPELVEGPTLTDRINQGRLPLDEALQAPLLARRAPLGAVHGLRALDLDEYRDRKVVRIGRQFHVGTETRLRIAEEVGTP